MCLFKKRKKKTIYYVEDLEMPNGPEKNLLYGLSMKLYENFDVGDMLFRNKDLNIRIEVYPSYEMQDEKLEYFRLTNSDISTDFTKIARISMREPKYIFTDDDGKEPWILNVEEKKMLVNILNSPYGYDYPDNKRCIWERIIIAYNNELGLDPIDSLENLMDDLKYPDWLPIDLPMPDYMQLNEGES